MQSIVKDDDSSLTHRPGAPIEPLWTVRRNGRSVRADMCRTERGWEVYLFSERQWFARHRLGSRGLALAWADSIYDDLVAEGWVPGSKSIHLSWGAAKNV